MNNLIIPPSANWYEPAILTCAPDNTLIYGSRNDIVIIYDSPENQPSDVKIIIRAHSQKIISTSINRNWGQPHKLLVTVAEDNIIKLWDVDTRKKKFGHNAHVGYGKVVGATFGGDNRVISVSEEGIIIVWNIILNQTNALKDIFGFKVTVTCISTCPHANWLTAFGLKNGLVVVTDLRKQGRVLYKLRGHDKSVLSLSWCPASINIFPKDPHNYVGVKNSSNDEHSPVNNTPASDESNTEKSSGIKTEDGSYKSTETDSAPTNLDPVESKPSRSATKNNIWSNLKHADDDEGIPSEKQDVIRVLFKEDSSDDFLKECQSLKDLIKVNIKPETVVDRSDGEKDRVVIKAKRNRPKGKQIQEKTDVETPSSIDDLVKDCGGDVENITDPESLKESTGSKELSDSVPEIEKSTESTEITEDDIPKTEALKESTSKEFADNASKMEKSTVSTEVTTEDIPKTEALRESTGSKELSDSALEIEKSTESTEITTEDSACPLSDQNNGVLGKRLGEKSSESKDSVGGISDAETEAVEDVKKEVIQDDNKLTCGDMKREIPVNVPEMEEPRREFLLASSGKEGKIYIWRAGTDGRLQTFLSLPHKPGHRKSGKFHTDKLWIVLCWVAPTILLSSSKSAELVQWILPKPKDKTSHFSLVHNDHNSILFSIAAPISLLNETNWLEERKQNVWTFGQDRQLLNTSLSSARKNLACYPTLGKAECFALSPVDPNRLAIGMTEGIIKVWDLSRPNVKCIVMLNFYQKIQSKVVTLAWHPTNELILAYGTLEGRIGFLDTSNKSKTPAVTPNLFKSQIHKIEWGPVGGSKENLGLFAVAEGKLVIQSGKKSETAPTEVDTPENTFVYSFAWKPDFSMLVVGTKAGTAILYSPELEILSTHYFQQKLKEIQWHPSAVFSNTNQSEWCYRFAAVSNWKDVIVCDLRNDIEDEERIVAKYVHSEDVINSVAWSPYTPDELVISSDDGTAQVWNVEKDTIEATYISPNFEGIFSTIWSPVDSDYMISAAKDHTVRVWKISDYPKQDEKELEEMRKKVIKEISKEQMDLLPKEEKVQEEAPKNKRLTKSNLLPNVFGSKDVSQIVGDLRRLFLWKEGSQDVARGGGDENFDILKIFGSKNDMLDVIEQSETIHRQKGKYSLDNTLSLFKGDISAKIKTAVDERRVTPWVIMMAPMVSPKLWQSACEVYAQQLSEASDSDPIEVATFYLACHKVEEAVNVLCDASMYREALALAKCRLPEDSPTPTTIIEKWAKHSMIVGNFEAAAQCYISLGKYEDAASVLFRRSDLETLKFAMELAQKSGNEDLYKAVSFRYNAFKNESEMKEKEKELLSKLDAVLKQHLEEGSGDAEASLESDDKDEERHDKKETDDELIKIVSEECREKAKDPEDATKEVVLKICGDEENLESVNKDMKDHENKEIVSEKHHEKEDESVDATKKVVLKTCGDEVVNLGKSGAACEKEEIISEKQEEETTSKPENEKLGE